MMATEYKLSYTAAQIDAKLGQIDNLATKDEVPSKTSELTNDSGFLTSIPAEYVTETEASRVAISAVNTHNNNLSAHSDIRAEISSLSSEKADKTQGIFYIEGDSSSTTDATNKVATWIGSHDEITEYFSGLTILYKVVTAGSTTTTLNINNLGAVTVVRNATTGISTSCPVDGVLLLTYTVDSDGTAYWKTADYDANTKNTAGTSNKTGTKLFLVGGASQSSSGVTTYSNSNVYINTSNQLYSAQGFSGDLIGNADTATKATQDASGNVIADTYETKADASTKLSEINEQISQLSSEKVDNPLYGKKVSFLGDSICAGSSESTSYLGGYGKIIADRNNMVYENIAKAGATITAETYSQSTGNARSWISRMVENMSADADYAIVEGGINDAWAWSDYGTIEIGEISNGYAAELDDTTYYGAFESMLKQLVTKFQGKKIGYIAVPKMMSLYDSNRNAPNFYHIALECCAKWGVPVCDLNTIIPPTEYLKTLGTTYTADGTHPTYEGYIKYYCDPIEAWMKTLTTGANVSAGVSLSDLDDKYVLKNDVQTKEAKFTLEDGSTVIINMVVASVDTTIKNYLNLIPTSIDTDGTVYNGVGYQHNTRLSSTGAAKESGGAVCTGFIPAVGGDVIRLGGTAPWYKSSNNDNYLCAYDSSFNYIGGVYNTASGFYYTENIAANSELGDVCTITLASGLNIAYIRASWPSTTGDIGADLIVTVNQEITG